MNRQIEELIDLKCDVQEAYSRIGEDEDFYLECVFGALNDQSFILLGDSLEKEDVENAFLHAHNLKGVLLNLSINPLIDDLSPLVEILRAKSLKGTKVLYEQLMEKRSKLLNVFNH